MHLRFTLSAPGTGHAAVDVAVDAPAGTPLAAVLEPLRRATGFDGAVYAGQQQLSPAAVLGRTPLLTGAALTVGLPGPPAPSPALLELRVVGGPACGDVHRLAPGQHRLGRRAGLDVRLADPDVSRIHAVLSVTSDGVTVRDAGSTNGTILAGTPLGSQPEPLRPGSLLQLGDSTLCLVVPDEPPSAVRPDSQGHLDVNRPPRLVRPPTVVEVALPAEPPPPGRPPFPVMAMVAPLVIGAVMVELTHSWTFALFMLLSPVMLGANALSERIGGRRSHRRACADYRRDSERAEILTRDALGAEALLRRAELPDAAALLVTATGPRPRLWERAGEDADALTLRVGTADLPARLALRSPDRPQASRHPQVRDVPVAVGLRDAGVLGLAGPRSQLAGLTRHLVAQLATLHSPRLLDLVILCAADGRAGSWRWASWLPHLRAAAADDGCLRVGLTPTQVTARVNELVTLMEGRRGAADHRRWTAASTVVVLDGARSLRSVPGVAQLLADGPEVGIHALCLASDPLDLPAECKATVVVTGATASRLLVSRAGHPPVEAVADLVSPAWAERLARGLAPLRDATPDGTAPALPIAVRLVDLLGGELPTADRIAADWLAGKAAGRAGSTTALLGTGIDGPFTVDLRRDGPHALVAGTTGAGKSELLQTLIASLCLVNRPDELAFVLVDYKGGAAFADCARLPHTVGLVTDLDGHLTRRALASLNAELASRERALGSAGCKDIDDYAGAGRPAGPMPRLVIVIDEFASLVAELPDFVTGLVDIARRGRSLGVHLVLATQRPGGVVSADIRSNTNLRIALRVTDPADSQDVIETKDAALVNRSTPGRAFCRTGAGDVAQFQCARVGGPTTPVDGAAGPAGRPGDLVATPAVRVLHWESIGDPAPVQPELADGGPTDLGQLVTAVRQAADRLGASAQPSPWLAPLPANLTLAELPGPAGPADALRVGLLDVPARQSQPAYQISLGADGHLLVAGGPRSGRTTLLRTLAGVIAATTEVTDLHVFGFDGAGGGLLPVAALPHAGAVVGRDEVDRSDRLLTRLAGEVRRRQQVLARDGFASVVEQRAAVAPDRRLPFLVLLIDGWEGLVATYDRVDAGRPVETLLGLLADGGAAGLRAVVAGDRTVLSGRLPSLIADRLILAMADPMDYALAGLAPRQIPASMPPGRGLVPGDPALEVQVALLTGDPTGPAQLAELARVAAEATRRAVGLPAVRRPLRVEPLPARLPYATAARAATEAAPLWGLLGVGGDDLTAVGVDLAVDGPSFLVSGPPRSGRSTALATMARWYAESGTAVLVVALARSPVCRVAGARGVFGPGDADFLGPALAAIAGPLVVVVDDAEALLDSPVEPVLCAVLSQAADRPWGLVVGGSTEGLATTYRGVTMEARKNRVGLLLAPSGPLDGDVLGVRLPRGVPSQVGRGVLAVHGRLTAVQVAC